MLGTAEAQCEFWLSLLQDYSLLNLLAAFSIILSHVSFPSCSLTSAPGDSLRDGDRQTDEEADRENRKRIGKT